NEGAGPYNDDIIGLGVSDAVLLSATITDGDEDTATDSIDISGTLQFSDDGPQIDLMLASGAVLQTDDGDLAGGNEGDGMGTDSDSAGVNDLFTVSSSAGADGDAGTTYSLALGANTMTGLMDAATDETVVLSLNGSVVEGRTTISNELVLMLNVDSVTGKVTLQQLRAVEHSIIEGAAPYSGDITTLGVSDAVLLNAIITDGDGDTATDSLDISDIIQFSDDGPILEFSNLVGTGTESPQIGFWDGMGGADQPATLSIVADAAFDIIDPNGNVTLGMISGFNESFDGTTGIGTLTGDFGQGENSVDFSLTVNTNGTYIFDLAEGFGSQVTLSSADGTLDAGGPDPVRTLFIPETDPPVAPSPSEEIVFFGVEATTPENEIFNAIGLGEADLTEAEVEAGGYSFLGNAKMNVSTAGIGLGNNNLNGDKLDGITSGDESFVINPESLLTGMKVFIDNSVAGYDTDVDPVTGFQNESLYYTIYSENGTTSGPTLVTAIDLSPEAGGQVSFDIEWDGSSFIDAVQLTMGAGTIKVPVIEFVQQEIALSNDVMIDFSATLNDADGDTSSKDFTVGLFGNDIGELFDYTLLDGGDPNFDAFDVDLDEAEDAYLIQGFDTGTVGESDQLYLLNGENGFALNTGSDLGAGDPFINDSEVIADGVSVIVEDATLTVDDITEIDTLIL
ncbi:Uncharacterized protein SCG7086_BK_00110, partial [Chlamydiales bacterium SCGC AG-110-P3]